MALASLLNLPCSQVHQALFSEEEVRILRRRQHPSPVSLVKALFSEIVVFEHPNPASSVALSHPVAVFSEVARLQHPASLVAKHIPVVSLGVEMDRPPKRHLGCLVVINLLLAVFSVALARLPVFSVNAVLETFSLTYLKLRAFSMARQAHLLPRCRPMGTHLLIKKLLSVSFDRNLRKRRSARRSLSSNCGFDEIGQVEF